MGNGCNVSFPLTKSMWICGWPDFVLENTISIYSFLCHHVVHVNLWHQKPPNSAPFMTIYFLDITLTDLKQTFSLDNDAILHSCARDIFVPLQFTQLRWAMYVLIIFALTYWTIPLCVYQAPTIYCQIWQDIRKTRRWNVENGDFTWASRSLYIPTHRLFVQLLVHAENKGSIRAWHYWLFVTRIHWSPVDSRHQWRV